MWVSCLNTTFWSRASTDENEIIIFHAIYIHCLHVGIFNLSKVFNWLRIVAVCCCFYNYHYPHYDELFTAAWCTGIWNYPRSLHWDICLLVTRIIVQHSYTNWYFETFLLQVLRFKKLDMPKQPDRTFTKAMGDCFGQGLCPHYTMVIHAWCCLEWKIKRIHRIVSYCFSLPSNTLWTLYRYGVLRCMPVTRPRLSDLLWLCL